MLGRKYLEEKTFGEIKRKERTAILASDMAPVVTGPKRTNKKGEHSNQHAFRPTSDQF